MCECWTCFSIKFIDTFLSVVIVIMNGVYAVWGILIPNSETKEQWIDYKNKLETYVNLVSYSDIVILPLKVLSMVLLKWCCCKCENVAKRGDDEYDIDDVYKSNCGYPSSSLSSQYTYNSKSKGVSEFHLN